MNKDKNLETNRSKVKRLPKRGFYDSETIYKILDETFVCQVGFSIENKPFVIPTAFGRKDNKIYFHGSTKSRMLKYAKDGIEICFTVTILDGIVFARSAFHHSLNYRSVILFGKAKEIEGKDEKSSALKIISDHIIPGRWNEVRSPNENELKATSVLSFEIKEGSAKIRKGPAVDEESDMNLPVWAGVVPFKNIPLDPVPDENMKSKISVPFYLKNFKV